MVRWSAYAVQMGGYRSIHDTPRVTVIETGFGNRVPDPLRTGSPGIPEGGCAAAGRGLRLITDAA